jgi:type 1 glutamine amidotransferase
MKTILMILILTGQSDLPFHEWRVTTPFLKAVLEKTGRFQVAVLEQPGEITPAALARYDAVLLNYNGPRWGSEAEAALEQFVRSGKGLIAFHGATYGPLMGTVLVKGAGFHREEGWPAYSEMLGATWDADKIGHAVRHSFTVKLTDREHPIARGLPAEFTVDDELYHKMTLRPEAHVIATAYSDPARRGTGREEPMAWTVSYGRGRVFYTPLGHDVKALNVDAVTAMLARAAEWVATGSVQ